MRSTLVEPVPVQPFRMLCISSLVKGMHGLSVPQFDKGPRCSLAGLEEIRNCEICMPVLVSICTVRTAYTMRFPSPTL